jgi:hypothetical protein
MLAQVANQQADESLASEKETRVCFVEIAQTFVWRLARGRQGLD